MLKLTIFCALLCLSAAFILKKANIPRTRGPRSLPGKTSNGIYKHPLEDLDTVAVAVYIGQPTHLIGNAYVDTAMSDVQVNLCPNANPTVAEEPCYNSYKSQTFIRISPNQAMDVFKGDNLDDKYMVNVTFTTHCDIESRFGFAWPELRQYPDDTFYPYVYLGQKGVSNRWVMAIAKDGCSAQIDWGDECTSDKYPTNYVPATSNKYWEFKLNGFTFGNIDQTFDSHAVIASTRSYIGMPKKYIEMMMQAHNITWDDEFGAYTTWCYGRMPDFKLKLQGTEISISSDQYLYTWLPLINGMCVVNFEDSAANGFGPEWYFGIPLLTAYCTTFDFDNYRIGFMYNDWYAGISSCHSQ
ncbi:hypothetical protein QR680_010802 [Steinernema hermaphroditum]|uniref:Peptidase A1 domain-containing protein n=1 Tax=Steinernema hermaphroditum TaxID=289476 RepID=A0AA39MBS7_9BILA|nr:hypothetical protein QR680_010802 [Steinernema hermaphroditum]